ncbi:MAG TPA: hypothetical protein VFL89_07675 [Solirubrobacterales bacterium]|jgi:hypothetical protein|nr:hypothetical protein [Solirubrobacterales bacterium]
MKFKILAVVATSVLTLAITAAAPVSSGSSLPVDRIGTASAAEVSKSQTGGGGGAGNVTDAGNRLGSLLSGWAVPVITVLAGCLLVGALASRNMGASLGIVTVSLVGLIFLLAPQSIETFAKGIANFVF